VDEPYVYENDKASESNFNVTVPEGFIWVMGDHRGASSDSRFHTDDVNSGMVPLNKVVGRATFIVWPVSNLDFLEKGSDLGKLPVKTLP
jgi:signal peptidase I